MSSRRLKVFAVLPSASQLESWGAWLALAFQNMGHEVRGFDYRQIALEAGIGTMNRRLSKQLNDYSPDITVIIKGELINPDALKPNDRFNTFLLANDDHQVWQTVSAQLGVACSKVFTFTKGSMPWYDKAGIDCEFMRFYADSKILTAAPSQIYNLYDVSFVGTYYPERESLVHELMKSAARGDLSFRLIGDGWDKHILAPALAAPEAKFSYGGRADYEEVLRTWHASKICLNIHQDGLKKLGVQANLRCYELGAAGCFMASDHVEGMEEAFGTPLPFKTLPDDWTDRKKTDALIEWAEKDWTDWRQKRATSLKALVLEKHTPQRRAEQILESAKL